VGVLATLFSLLLDPSFPLDFEADFYDFSPSSFFGLASLLFLLF
jgi:hypothetical protein